MTQTNTTDDAAQRPAAAEHLPHAGRDDGRMEQILVPVPGPEALAQAAVGAKAWSLDRLARAGFTVPPAQVLTTAFFAPWMARVRATPAWQALTGAPPSGWADHCAALLASVQALDWDPEQRRALEELGRRFAASGVDARFAVRSSSPDEDLAHASFAGVYRTFLGVPGAGIEQAIRACFASCLAYPVFAYKAARGLPVFEPAIAVIVQRQVDSEVSGVGFSVNPLTNDHDEAYVCASWGLGESVVDGRVAPDQFVLDKASARLLRSELGSKQSASALAPAGGTCRREEARGARFCLGPGQLAELTRSLARIEALFGAPVDVEFAYADQALQLLQARPVTACVPLAPGMMSAPGATRTLYMDIALAKGMTLNAPVSPMGQDWLKHTIGHLVRHCAGPVDLPLDRADGWICIEGGRMYLNLSRLLWLATPRQLARSNAPTDQLLSETLETVELAHYRAPARPSLLTLLSALPRMLWRLRRAIWRSLGAFVAPALAHRAYLARERDCVARLSAPADPAWTLPRLQAHLGAQAAAAIVDVAMPAMLAGVGATAAMARLARRHCADEQRLAAQLMRGVKGNLVVEMGIAMFRLARMLAPADFADLERLAARIARREMAPDFLAAWDGFMADYGCRGPGEMDLANPAYRDDPRIVLRQMSFMAAAPGHYDPQAAQRLLAGEREAAYRELLARFGPVRRLLLKRLFTVSELFACTRDTPKHLNLLARQGLRQHLLAAGAELAARGRLDNAQDIFGLRYADLETGGPGDLRARRRERTAFLDTLAARVKSFPALIDSRGRILRPPPRPLGPGQLRGTALSPGVARGRVKCLRTAHEKAIAPGDILVAFTTDPGWTPLFVNAAAIVLEIGGVLQHGALVAREFNKPCVAGIGEVFERLHDGQLVEVDGDQGRVRILEDC